MSIAPGQTLQHYRLVEKIGEGGMGEVWLARDVRLERDVAVKILPPGFASNELFRARFQREGKAISSLNHPHICTLFDIGSEGDTHFLVMERLEGESLADRLKKGPLSLDSVLEIGSQIASALAAAHRAGITHRDLKPDNVMLTRAVGAKLLDFGLAKTATETGPPIDGLTSLPTQVKPLTTEGTILGTFQYMAPEQLEGIEADARTDIFALGALLYEMTTGRRAFEGKNKTSLIAAIVSSQPPPISSVQPMTPPALDHVVRKCLEKDPEDRWQSAGDVASQLRWIAEAGSQAGAPVAVVSTRRKRRNLLVLSAVAGWGIAAVLLGFTALRTGSPGHDAVLRAEMVVPPGITVGPVLFGHVVLSPDGSRLAFLGLAEGSRKLMVRDLASGEVRALEGTEGAESPFWSADGRRLAFFTDEKLKKIDAGGGPVQVVADAHAGRGGTWNRDGTIVFAADIQGPLLKVSENGGATTPVTSPANDDVTHRMPHFLPDGENFLFLERQRKDQLFGNIAVGSIDGRETRVVVESASNPQYADGYLFFVRDGNLVAQKFDPVLLAVEGALIPLADTIDYFNPRDIGNYTVSASGLLVYRKRSLRQSQLGWFDLAGTKLATVGERGYYLPSVAGTRRDLVTLRRLDPSSYTSDIWIVDLEREQTTRATFVGSNELLEVAISPDGTRLAVSAPTKMGTAAVWIQPLSGSGSREVILESTRFLIEDWSKDGRYLIGMVQETGTGFDVCYVDLEEEKREPRTLVATRYIERGAKISPDGRWLAYMSDETGRPEIYLTDFPAGNRKWQVSTSSGDKAWWSADGRELFFMGEGGVFTASIAEEGPGTLRVGSPRKAIDYEQSAFENLSPPLAIDGERFLALGYDDAAPEPLHLIRGWTEELE
jgi:Tol biopolymer transport system component